MFSASISRRQKFSREAGSFSSVCRMVCSRRCSSLSATCAVENVISTRFLPKAPERAFFRYISCSSCCMRPIEASIQEMISLLLLT